MNENGQGPRRARPAAVSVVVGSVLVLVALVWTALAWRFELPLPAPPVPADLAAPVVQQMVPPRDRAASAHAESGAEPMQRERFDPGVSGVLLDSDGRRLTGYRVALSAPRPLLARDLLEGTDSPRRGDVAVTDGEGRFAFGDLVGGEHVVSLSDWPQMRVVFTLPKHGHEFVELRLPPELVALEGRFVRGGVVQTDVRALLECATGEHIHGSSTERDGCIRMVVPAGAHTLHARADYQGRRSSLLSLARHALSVPRGSARKSWEVEVAGCDVEVVVREQSGLAVDNLAVEIRGVTTREQDELSIDGSTKGGNSARLRRLPPGHYLVRVQGADILPGPPCEFDIGFGLTQLQVPITVHAAATVRLRLLAGRRRELSLSPEFLPPLIAGDHEIASSDLPGASRGTVSRHLLGYRSVPPGPVELHFADREVDDRLVFLPFDPPAMVETTVRSGSDNEIVLDVVPRAHVDLRACEQSGREQAHAVVTVFTGGQRVRSSEATPRRFRSYLPPGDYRVVVDRNGQISEHTIVVVRADIRLRLRP